MVRNGQNLFERFRKLSLWVVTVRYMSSTAESTSRGPTVLVVEDDQGVRESLQVVLQVQGYEVIGVDRGEEGLATLAERAGSDTPVDLVVLDLNLPGIDGVETCRRLRQGGHDGPVLMLTARHDVSDRVRGLDAGADDYLPKPFALDELLARIRSLLRSFAVAVGSEDHAEVSLDDLVIDHQTRQVTRSGVEVEVTKLEFDLLNFLVENESRVLTRNDIMREIWGYEEDVSSNTLEVFISGLRKKLEKDGASRLIYTKRGVGYVARAPR